jgi:hypothetical protein
MMIATAESLLGSVWFGMMMLCVGYIAGHVLPVGKIADLFRK